MSQFPNTDIELFQQFSKSPKSYDIQVLKASHRYLNAAIKGDENAPKCSELINIFNQFTEKNIKDYVCQRMKKTILLELALCIVQEIAAGGPQRAKSLQLEVEKTSSGGKQVVISGVSSNEFPLSPADSEFMRDIDEALFTISDLSGKSPAKQIISGQGRAAPYETPDADGFFTPKKQMQRRSLERDLDEVSPHA